ncbi:MAG: hypothetical protein HY077_12750 [Elusimicrobia bacterium]|nr:hypothetical protein [Elusimicrobiota bacterium]
MPLWALLAASLLASSPARAAKEVRGTLELASGYRKDSLNWNIGFPATPGSPDVLSELTWRRVVVYDFQLRLSLEYAGVLQGRLKLGRGVIVDGDVQDSDFGGSGRTFEFSRSDSKANKGYTQDVSLGVGARISGAKFSLSPLPLGMSYDSLNLRMSNGVQTHSSCAPNGQCGAPVGPITGLNSSYNASWTGPWSGVDAEFAEDDFLLRLTYEYHWKAKYSGKADWNLRQDLAHPVSFKHAATGAGTVAELRLDYVAASNWSVGIAGTYQSWSAEAGTDTTFLAGGAQGAAKLNKVRWNSLAASVVLALRH